MREVQGLRRYAWIWAGPLGLGAAYGFLAACHESWDSGEPVLHVLTPLMTGWVWIGNQVALPSAPKALYTLALGAIMLPLLIGLIQQRKPGRILTAMWLALACTVMVMLGWRRLDLLPLLAGLLLASSLLVLIFDRHADAPPTPAIQTPWVWVLIITLLAVVVRFYHLDILPPGINDEEAGFAYQMRHYLDGREQVLRDHWQNDRPLSWLGNAAVMVCVGFFKLYAFTPLAFRFAGAVPGVLTVLLVYALAAHGFGRRVGFLSAFFMAVSPWLAFYSRINYPHCSLAVMQSVATFAVAVWAVERRSYLLFALLGVLMGASAYVYETGKITVLGAGAATAWLCLRDLIAKDRPLRFWTSARLAATAAVFLAVTLVPYAHWAQTDPAYLLSPAGSISMQKAAWSPSDEEAAPTAVIRENLRGLAPVVAWRRVNPSRLATTDDYASPTKGLVRPLVAVCLLVGLAVSLRHGNRRSHQILLLWGLTALLPALFTSVIGKRMLVAAPPLFIWAGLGANALLGGLGGLTRGRLTRVVVTVWVAVATVVLTGVEIRELLTGFPRHTVYRADYTTHRHVLREAVRETGFYTDIQSSILKFILHGAGPYTEQTDFGNRAMEHIGLARNTERGVAFMADAYVPRNVRTLIQLHSVFPDSTLLSAPDFVFLNISPTSLQAMHGFESSDARPAEAGRATGETLHRGTLVVGTTGRYRILAASGIDHLSLNGVAVPLDTGAATTGDMLLSAGTHLIEVATPTAAPPEWNWERLDPTGETGLPPFVCQPRLYQLEDFRGVGMHLTDAAWPLLQRIPLPREPALGRAVRLWVDADGSFLVTDAGGMQIVAYDQEGGVVSRTATTGNTPAFGLRDPRGEPYAALPHTVKSVARLADGDIAEHFPPWSLTIDFDAEGHLLSMTTKTLHRYRMAEGRPGERLQTFTPPHPSGSTPLALAQNGKGLTVLLTDAAILFVLNADFTVQAQASVGAAALGQQPQLAADDTGRVYLTVHERNMVMVFDLLLGELQGLLPTQNCPIRVTKPLDAMARGDRLYVLGQEPSGYVVSVFGIPP